MVAGKHARGAGFAAAGLAAVLSINCGASNQEKHKPSLVVERDAWPLVHIPDPVARRTCRQALDQARELLAKPRCRSVLTQFADGEGLALADRLDALGVDVQTYLTMIVFLDGTRYRSCVTGVVAFTRPGSRVVHLCLDELKRTWRQKPAHVVAAFIHELLHTLGLGENPPAPREITARVQQSCWQ